MLQNFLSLHHAWATRPRRSVSWQQPSLLSSGTRQRQDEV